jgi:glutaminyl-peptide cyclotransferase
VLRVFAALLTLGVLGWLGGFGCAIGWPAPLGIQASGRQAVSDAAVEQLRPQVLAVFPHDRGAFTQGLLLHEGSLYESTGLYGRSTLRQVDPRTGDVKRVVSLAPTLFGEGLARVDDRLIQITWQHGVAPVYNLLTFEQVGQFTYSGEGWGLCYDGQRLVMSNGSSNLTFRDPQTFAVAGTVGVTLKGQPVERLNELECVGQHVYANVWQTDTIVRIHAETGRVDATIDASGLLSPEDRIGVDVLNGIAYDPERDVFLITGKLWPRLFEVRFVP